MGILPSYNIATINFRNKDSRDFIFENPALYIVLLSPYLCLPKGILIFLHYS